jgi:hypothetical protein
MKLLSLVACFVLAAAPAVSRAEELCDQLGEATQLAKTGFNSVEGDPAPGGDGRYRRSTIQLSAGDHCAIEAHKVLSCAWEPSTENDMAKMTGAIATCFPNAQQATSPAGGDLQTTFKLDHATIVIDLTADVMSLNVGP